MDARPVHCRPGEPDARNRLKAGAERRHECAVECSPDGTGHTWLQLRQFEEVPAVQRQVFDLLASDHAAHLVVVVADERNGASHCHRVAHLTDFERQVDRRRRSRLDARGAFHALESLDFYRHRVLSGR